MTIASARSALALAWVLFASAAGAAPADENITYGYAQVMRATPVFANERVSVPEEQCDQARPPHRSVAGTVAGAIVGGALGNQVGKGDGRKAATVAGAVLGGAIGRRVQQDAKPRPGCRMVDVERDQRRQVGYDVEYKYKGEVYMSRLPIDPGNRLRVRASVMPADPAIDGS